jgi:hypothetical protein
VAVFCAYSPLCCSSVLWSSSKLEFELDEAALTTRTRMLSEVDVVAAAQAVVGDREQGVAVRQLHADDLGFLVDPMVDEARSWWEKPLLSRRQT